MDKKRIFWRTASVIYWCYVLWYLFNGALLADWFFVATGILAFLTPIPYLLIFGILIYVMLGYSFW